MLSKLLVQLEKVSVRVKEANRSEMDDISCRGGIAAFAEWCSNLAAKGCCIFPRSLGVLDGCYKYRRPEIKAPRWLGRFMFRADPLQQTDHADDRVRTFHNDQPGHVTLFASREQVALQRYFVS
jgi:hypothetical protein